MAALTQATLDAMRCATPGCTCDGELYFHGMCHPESLTTASYQAGVLAIRCGTCEKLIAEVAVAP